MIYIRSRYHQIRVRGEDVHQTTFQTWYGNYYFLAMSFDLKNAPTTFMDHMNRVFRNYLDFIVIVFIDVIFLNLNNEGYHMDRLRVVFQYLKEHKLFAKYSNCEFLMISVAFLGHII